MKYISIIALSVSILTFSQTKKIAFKSHSGNAANFEKYLNHKMFDSKNSNLGEAPTQSVINAVLDSVIFISDEKQVMVTRACNTTFMRGNNQIVYKDSIWKPGRDTVIHHTLFQKKHDLAEVKRVIHESYNFRNKINDVVFIGYDNDSIALQKEKRKEEIKLNEEAIKKTKAELKKLKKELKKRKKTKIQGVGFGFGLMILLVGGVYWLKK